MPLPVQELQVLYFRPTVPVPAGPGMVAVGRRAGKRRIQVNSGTGQPNRVMIRGYRVEDMEGKAVRYTGNVGNMAFESPILF